MWVLLTIVCLYHVQCIRADNTTSVTRNIPQFFLIDQTSDLIDQLQRTIADITEQHRNHNMQYASTKEQSGKLTLSTKTLSEKDDDLYKLSEKHERILAQLNNSRIRDVIKIFNDDRTEFMNKHKGWTGKNSHQIRFASPNVDLKLINKDHTNMDIVYEELELPEALENAKKWITDKGDVEGTEKVLEFWNGHLKKFAEFCVDDRDRRQEVQHVLDYIDFCRHGLWKNQAERLILRSDIETGRIALRGLQVTIKTLEYDIQRDEALLVELHGILDHVLADSN